jgi:NADPH2:quinone reductase
MALRLALSRSAVTARIGARQALPAMATRSMALGPAVGGQVSDELLQKLGTLSTQSLIDGLWVMGWPTAFIEGARPLEKGMKCVGRAVTLNFVPQRPDIAADKPAGMESPEYEAFEACGPNDVLVMASVGPWESVGGDIKFLRLMQRDVGGLVTDGSVRDTDELLGYGFPVFSYSTTPKQGPAAMQPWQANGVIECGGVVVRPGDAIIGDQDGVVCVPASHAQEVYDRAHGREEIEVIIKEELTKNPGPPGKYYPFKPPIKPDSPLGKLLTAKGHDFSAMRGMHTRAGSGPFTSGRVGGARRHMSSVPATMKAVVIRENGPAENLLYEEGFPTPTVADGQVLVKNEFTGINFIDTYFRKGGPAYTQALPFVSGQEGGGTIVQTTPGAEAQGLKVGQRVAYSVLGTYCEYTAVPAPKIVNVPDSVGLDVATALMTQGLTAHYLTNSAHAGLVKPGEWMLIHGIGGGTCQWAAQMAKLKGYKVIGTAPKGKEDVAAATGVDELIVTDVVPGTPYEDYTSVDIVKKVMEITNGEGVKAVIDGIGASTVDISIESLSRRGIFVTFGNASGPVPAFPPIRLIKKSAFLTRPKLLDYVTTRDELMSRADEIFGWLQEGHLKVGIDKIFDLSDAVAGHNYLEAGKSKGKVLYKIP